VHEFCHPRPTETQQGAISQARPINAPVEARAYLSPMMVVLPDMLEAARARALPGRGAAAQFSAVSASGQTGH
jgi:hypothetical protein